MSPLARTLLVLATILLPAIGAGAQPAATPYHLYQIKTIDGQGKVFQIAYRHYDKHWHATTVNYYNSNGTKSVVWVQRFGADGRESSLTIENGNRTNIKETFAYDRSGRLSRMNRYAISPRRTFLEDHFVYSYSRDGLTVTRSEPKDNRYWVDSYDKAHVLLKEEFYYHGSLDEVDSYDISRDSSGRVVRDEEYKSQEGGAPIPVRLTVSEYDQSDWHTLPPPAPKSDVPEVVLDQYDTHGILRREITYDRGRIGLIGLYRYATKLSEVVAPRFPGAGSGRLLPVRGRVNSGGLRLRVRPSLKAAVVGYLPEGARLMIDKISDKAFLVQGMRAPWYHVNAAGGRVGWVYAYFVDAPLFNRVSLVANTLSAIDDYYIGDKARVIANDGILYGDLSNYKHIGHLHFGDRVTVLGIDDHYYQHGQGYTRFVHVAAGGVTGWMESVQLTKHLQRYRSGYAYVREIDPLSRFALGGFAFTRDSELVYASSRPGHRVLAALRLTNRGPQGVSYVIITGLRVSDVNHDGIPDLVAGANVGGGPYYKDGSGSTSGSVWYDLENGRFVQLFFERAKSTFWQETVAYAYVMTRNPATGMVTKIKEISHVRSPGSSKVAQVFTRTYTWNGHRYK